MGQGGGTNILILRLDIVLTKVDCNRNRSEAVLLQFGDLVLIRGEKLVDRWPVLPVSV